jgi:hypothetical protein
MVTVTILAHSYTHQDVIERLETDGLVVLPSESRVSAKRLQNAVREHFKSHDEELSSPIIPLAIGIRDEGWHQFLVNDEVQPYDSEYTPRRAKHAVYAWMTAGQPSFFRVHVT